MASLRRPAQLWSRPRRPRLYTSERHQPRARRATDLLLLLASLLGLAVLVPGADPPSTFEDALAELFTSTPDFLDIVWRVLARLLLVWAALLFLVSLVRRRPAIARDLVVSCAGAAVAATVIAEEALHGGGLAIWDAITQTDPPASAVSVPLAIAAAATVVTSPHIARPFRSTSRWLLAMGTISLVCLGAATPSGAAIGLLCGVLSAATVHLVLGSSAGLPSLDEVQQALDDLDVETGALLQAQRQTAGVFRVDTVDPQGAPLVVKVYGRDARDAQLVAKAWRTLWYRSSQAFTLTRVQQAEHEAFVTLFAERAGVHVDYVVRAGRSASNDAVVVLRRLGDPVTELATESRRQVLEPMWDEVLALHDAGIAHGDLAPGRFRTDGDHVVVSGLTDATMAPTGDQFRIDLAQLLVTTVLLAGTDAAIEVAMARLGPDGLATVLPYLQPAGLGAQLRADVHAADLDLDEVREGAAGIATIDAPPMAKLRRVSRGGIIRTAILVAVAYFLISSLSGIDFQQVVDELQGASLGILFAALLLGQTPRFAQAEATRGACPRPVAYGPLALLQFAITFVNLVLPSTAARVAVNIRFFQRQGIPPASAVSIGVIDGLGGFVIQLTILASVLLFGFGDVQLDLQLSDAGGSGNLLRIIALMVAVVVLIAIVVAVVPALRHKVVERVKPWIHEVLETVGSLRSPTKVAQILGGNLVAEILFASTLALVLVAFDSSLPLGTLLVINVGVSLFAGIMPVPGGIGVSEGALVVGLTAAGVDQATALAVAMSYRIVTFYLPPVWGAIAFRRLERAGFI